MDEDRKLTKKELKALRRLERQEKEMGAPSGSGGKGKWFILGIVAVLFVGFFAYMVYLSREQRAAEEKKALETLTKTDSGTIKGDKNANVTITEFADFQCPSCQYAYPIVNQTLKDLDGKVKLNYKHFPLIQIHPNAVPAAKAAEAAGKQGKFWEMADLLYTNQSDWQSLPNPIDKFTEYAETLKLDVDKFRTDMESQEIADKIEKEREEGINVGVSGTPTFFVNGEKIESPANIEEFKKILEPYINKK